MSSPLKTSDQHDSCTPSRKLEQWRQWRALQRWEWRHAQVESGGVVWVSREVFDHVRPGRLSDWQRGRVVDNEGEVVAALQAAIRVRPTRCLVGVGALTCVVDRHPDPLATRVTLFRGRHVAPTYASDLTGPPLSFASVYCSNLCSTSSSFAACSLLCSFSCGQFAHD